MNHSRQDKDMTSDKDILLILVCINYFTPRFITRLFHIMY